MSTIRVDNLQTTDSTVTRAVSTLVDRASMDSAIATSVDAVYESMDSAIAASVGAVYVTGVAAIAGIDKTKATRVYCENYYAGVPGGGGLFLLDTADTTSAADGGTVIVATDGGRWKRPVRNVVSVREYGARGDGSTDDTLPFRRAVAYACTRPGTGVYVPAGFYLVQGNLQINTSAATGTQSDRINMQVFGDGRATEIVHTGDQPLFVATGMVYNFSARDFTVRNSRTSTNASNGVFMFPEGNCQSDFTNVHYLPNAVNNSFGTSFYVCAVGKTNDSVNFNNCYIFVTYYGIQLGAGSSVYINGGRIVGPSQTAFTGTGLRLTGGMGGVWVTGTDCIFLSTGISVEQVAGQVSNRELFLISGCTDSCNVGLNISDAGSYTSWTGAWAASCNAACINYAPTSDSAILNISGGSIFNAGALDTAGSGLNYGLSVNQFGRLEVSGVTFRNNRGRGLSINSGARAIKARITECNFHDNGTAGRTGSFQAALAGAVEFKNNTLDRAVAGTVAVDTASAGNTDIRDNTGYMGFGLRATPPTGASGTAVTNTTGQRLIGYIRGGAVTSVFVAGQPVYDNSAAAAVNAQIVVQPGETFSIGYTSAPNIQWYFA